MTADEPTPENLSYKVQIWKTEVRVGKRKSTHIVQWAVGGKRKKQPFASAALAEGFRAELVAAARKGEAFDMTSGLPMSKLRKQSAPTTLWFRHACAYTDMKWDDAAPKTRVGIAESLATVTPVLLSSERGAPDPATMRKALYGWAFNTSKRTVGNPRQDGEPPEELAAAVAWLASHTLPVSAFNDPAVARRALDAISRRIDGTKAAASTVYRKRAVFYNVLEYAVELKLIDANPLEKIKKRAPKTAETVNPAVLPDRRRAESLFTAVGERRDSGKRLVAYYKCIYYAAMRPAEVAELRESDFTPPRKQGGWGEFHLRKSAPSVPREWSDSRTHRRETRQLKHRGVDDFRIVPCHPHLAQTIAEHIRLYGVTADGRLFRGARGGPLPDSVTSQVWRDARAAVLTKRDREAGIAQVPYDLRHACVTNWLNAGVDAAQVAAWAGHSVAVLMRVYVQCIVGRDEIARRKIEAAFEEDDAEEADQQPGDAERLDEGD
jgi:integrase